MSPGITRREILKAALASPIVAAASHLAPAQNVSSDQLAQYYVARSPAKVISVDGSPVPKFIQLVRRWRGSLCHSRLTNHGPKPVRIREVVLFDYSFSLPATTKLYGEGFQMLTQTGGNLGSFSPT